ncbi:MAG: hypothetical protein KC478_04535 [Bacteriovoracaceae bacterium]|nr:hypothetical protein [Bacteriovoracaceae bacterium]
MNLFHYDVNDATLYNIEEVGTVLDDKTRAFISKCMEELLEKSPARSFANLLIKKEKAQFSGELRIESFTRTFFVEAKADNERKLFFELEQKIKTQLRHWRMTRSLDIGQCTQNNVKA